MTDVGETVEFAGNGAPRSSDGRVSGYLAPADGGAGLGILVVHEWWGVVPHIVDVCDRFAAEGFTALAPDLYHGRTVPNREPDEARQAAGNLDSEQAARDMAGAVDYLSGHPAVRGDGLGVVGFWMGGSLALWLATLHPDAIRAVVEEAPGIKPLVREIGVHLGLGGARRQAPRRPADGAPVRHLQL